MKTSTLIEKLRRMGFDTPEQVAEMTAAELVRHPNFGWTSLRKTKEWLADHGLTLACERIYARRRIEAIDHEIERLKEMREELEEFLSEGKEQ